MKELCFDVSLNPFGIQYNPASISAVLQRMIKNQPFEANELIQHNDLWHSLLHHGNFSSASKTETLNRINEQYHSAVSALKSLDFLFITLGTAWIYEYRQSGEVVANCHKIPAAEFRRFRLTTPETVHYLQTALEGIWTINPEVKIVFTVSPIRHTSDGAIENQLSKSTLLLAVDALINGFGNSRCAYFPSYEIVMDELRDYRFYADDMVHLSSVAEQYIWDKFASTVIGENDQSLMQEINRLVKAGSHRPFRPEEVAHQQFIHHNLAIIADLESKYSYINLTTIKNAFRQQLTV